MDSITQFALGATVGVAVLGRRTGLRKAALTGGLLATLPDLDVFWPRNDPVESFVTHRSATHSLLMHSLVTPILGESIRWLFRDLRDHRMVCYLAVFLCLTTHALLDSMTIYGTQLFWPLWKEPLGLGSIFIIDPLYTLPLLFITVWALVLPRRSKRFYRCLAVAVILSCGYLIWGVGVQTWVLDFGKREFAKLAIEPDQILATPVPFSSLFWRVIATDRTHDYSLYVPILAAPSTSTTYINRRIPVDLLCWVEKSPHTGTALETLSKFSHGYYRLDTDGTEIRYSDLRMGLSHTYAFQFHIANRNGANVLPVTATRLPSNRRHPGDLDWLLAGIFGQKMIRPIERDALVEGSKPRLYGLTEATGATC